MRTVVIAGRQALCLLLVCWVAPQASAERQSIELDRDVLRSLIRRGVEPRRPDRLPEGVAICALDGRLDFKACFNLR